ncbi:MAG: hypothetical protein JRC92_07910 [Deltaproteobacteria bacterium]|nr:hypothetical protein [Deltaproteobacteria bacterium]
MKIEALPVRIVFWCGLCLLVTTAVLVGFCAISERKVTDLAIERSAAILAQRTDAMTEKGERQALVASGIEELKADLRQEEGYALWEKVTLAVGLAAGGLIAFWLVGMCLARSFRRVTRELTGTSDQLSTSSQGLAQSFTAQTASVEQASSSLEEIAAQTKANSDNAGQADALMSEAQKTLDLAGRSLEEMAGAMTQVAEAGGQINKTIRSLEEIASQTNLLALNASVEAARAGEAGTGFVTVADEIRRLALRANQMSQETEGLVEETVQRIDQGSKLLEKTRSGFFGLADSASRVGAIISQIVAASAEQAQSVVRLDEITQLNAAQAGDSANVAEQMNDQSVNLKKSVTRLAALVDGMGTLRASLPPALPEATPPRPSGQIIAVEDDKDLSEF